jgi:protein O-mannosyl-transferase
MIEESRPRGDLLPVAMVGIAIAAAIAYLPALRGDFLFDDLSEIVENPAIRTLWPPWRPMFAGGELPHRPLPYYSFAISHAVGGLDPIGFHLTNLAIHLLNGWLLWWVAAAGLARQGCRHPRETAAIAAALWLVHPIQTQAVAYAYQRIELLAATAALATLAFFMAAVASEGRRGRAFSVAAVVSCAAGMACKEWMVVVPLVILLYDALLVSGSWRETLRRRWALHAAIAGTWLVLAGVVGMQRQLYPEFAGGSAGSGLLRRLLYLVNQPPVILWYLSLLVAPVGQSLDHGTPLRAAWWLAVPFILVAAGFLSCVAAARRAPAASFLGLTFFLLLAPTSSILPIHDLCVEHRMYLPSACVAVAFALALGKLAGPKRATDENKAAPPHRAILVAAGLMLLLAGGTFNRARVFASPLAAWSDAVAKSATSSRARSRLATELSELDRHAEAIEMASAALALDPKSAVEHAALAAALMNAGRDADAVAVCRRGLALGGQGGGWADPVSARLSLYRGIALNRLGDPAGLPLIEQAVASRPDSLFARESLARALAAREPARAAALYADLVALAPADADRRYDFGCMLARIDPNGAEREFREAIRLDPTHADAFNNLGSLLVAAGRFDEATAAFRSCLAIDPEHPLARRNLDALQSNPG